MPSTPQQSSHSSVEERQWHIEVEDQTWNARDRTVIARMEQYLEKSDSMKAQVEELESLLGPEDSDVDFRRILEEARNRRVARSLKPSAQRVRVPEKWMRTLPQQSSSSNKEEERWSSPEDRRRNAV